MKYIFFILIMTCLHTTGQVRIHAHNDYEKPLPLFNALKSKAYSIEADVFLRNGQLMVAHSRDQLKDARSIQQLYIEPLAALFKKYKGKVSEDTGYRIALMVDIKEGGEQAIRQLTTLLAKHRSYFDRNRNRYAAEIIISGDRGNIKNWTSFPSFILFDGRPYEIYNAAQMKRVACISDSYARYAENKEKLNEVIERSHRAGKPFRFWGTPDNEFYWKYFKDAGVDLINTDKPELCSRFFEKETAKQ